jgi:hypothetical protein
VTSEPKKSTRRPRSFGHLLIVATVTVGVVAFRLVR